ncbi:hypothetical protein FOZ60_008369 [Perkinsus olseni]|uniref:Glutathione S-transferase kappa n=1 Tax=Perkinsus olseni TaxID=32597 RepID=A0A7J6NJC1_PEROL|nr:hypothetical protein FOZ60_008369 [Perkinsus olseni]
MPSGDVKVEFFYDVISPYTYLAWQTLKQYRTAWNVDVVLRPVFLGGIMKGSKNRPPAMVPNKGKYMQEDLRRAARILDVLMLRAPRNFFSQVALQILTVQRLLAAASDQKTREKLTESAFKALWEDNSLRDSQNNLMEINDEFLRGICGSAGLDGTAADKMIEESKTVGKADLVQATDEALEKYHSFGSPTIVVHACDKPHTFFGGDRWEHIAHLLNKEYHGINPARKLGSSGSRL